MTLPRISILSLFRDDAGENIARYHKQILSLQYPAGLLRFYLVEGDSQDNTLGELQAWAIEDDRIRIIKHDTDVARMRHTPHPERLRCLAETGNAALEALAQEQWGDLAMLIESDLQFQPTILSQLLADKPKDASVIAPYIWIATENRNWVQFYDVWAFRDLNGKMFPAQTPEFFVAQYPGGPFEVESVGSMVLMDAGPLYDGVRYTNEWAIRGICLQYRKRGLKVYADPNAHVLHPFVQNPIPLVETKANEK